MGQQGGRARNVTGGNRAEGRDSPLQTKTAVLRDGELDPEDEAGIQEGDGEG